MNLTFLELPRRSPACGQCGQSLPGQFQGQFQGQPPGKLQEEEEFCYSHCEDGKRRDYCTSCWDKDFKNNFAAHSTLYFWKTRLPKKNATKAPMRKELRALEYLKEIIGCESKEEEQFFLSLFLMRKKMLFFRKEIEEEGRTYQLFEAVTTGELLPIRKLPLSKLDHARVQKEIAMQLNGQQSY